MAMIGAPRGALVAANGMFGAPPPSAAPPLMAPPPSMAPPPKKKINWMGVLADALSGAAGQPGQYAASMRKQQAEQTDFERGERQYNSRRQSELDDYGRKLEMQNDPRYAKPDVIEDNAGNRWKMDPATGQRVLDFVDNTPKSYIQDGMLVNVPNPYATGAPSPAPRKPRVFSTLPGEGGQSVPPAGTFPEPYDPLHPYYR